MTTHKCPTCRHEHETPNILPAIYALGALARANEGGVSAPIRNAMLAPGAISVTVETEDGLRSLASHLRLPEPSREGICMETQGSYAGVHVFLRCHTGV